MRSIRKTAVPSLSLSSAASLAGKFTAAMRCTAHKRPRAAPLFQHPIGHLHDRRERIDAIAHVGDADAQQDQERHNEEHQQPGKRQTDDEALAHLQSAAPGAKILEISARTGVGMDAWYKEIRALSAKKTGRKG